MNTKREVTLQSISFVTRPAGASVCLLKSVVGVHDINIAVTDMCHFECSGLTLMIRTCCMNGAGQMFG
jgi:hypothetical protein